MGKKAKAHRAKVAKRNRQFNAWGEQLLQEHIENLLKIKRSVWEKVEEYGFSTIDETWEKAPWAFLEVFPGEEPETIYNALKLDWIRE